MDRVQQYDRAAKDWDELAAQAPEGSWRRRVCVYFAGVARREAAAAWLSELSPREPPGTVTVPVRVVDR